MMTFTVTYSQALDMLVENLHAWYWNPDLSAYAVCKALDSMTFEELEDLLHQHIKVIEQIEGVEPGLFSTVRFKIVRDHELVTSCTANAKPQKRETEVMPVISISAVVKAALSATDFCKIFRQKRGQE